MDKLLYLSKTLSRTSRKDYENYVINAIWNRIGDNRLLPVSQQCVRKEIGSHYFIDLYFPQLNIGVECDEAYHLKNQQNDSLRELTIFDILGQISKDDYLPLHIDVSKSFDEVEKQINSAVKKIKDKIEEFDSQGRLLSWDTISPAEYYKNKTKITTKDSFAFHTITEVSNCIFGTKYSCQQHAWFHLEDNLYAWFPKLAIKGKAVSRGWNNTISADGKTIIEYNENEEKNQATFKDSDFKQIRVTFTQVKNPVTGIKEYRFVGVFKSDGLVDGKANYTKISDEFEIIRNN